uniref:Brix domain-containing protein n=1 Tax=Chaetoceros debilis TaxID=122233 RepID=A0A7S3Q262_9STRA|mmetsp:Transcript_3277/g.4638  ORF Transcript_3277/g.4638 Transcript_3277/m.4638 type:complete len:434 (+) Transcript_3277:106-1407(+)
MPKKGAKRKKTRTHVVENETQASAVATEGELKVPRSLVVRRGAVEAEVIELVQDLRHIMMPYTAMNFQASAKLTKLSKSLQHYSKELSGTLGLTHIMSISQNESKLAMRLARTPAGPTLTFKIQQFSLSRNVRKVQRRPFDISAPAIANNPPIVVTNNFGDQTAAPHVKLMRITFQNMFPALNVATVKLRDCRRVVLFNFLRRQDDGTNANGQEIEDEEVEIRHYAVRATPVGITKKVRRIIQAKIPNLSKLEDISDWITGTTASGDPAPAASGAMSDSEAEDETSHVVLPQKYSGKGNSKAHKSALKLVELGPRLRIKLTKVERGLASGDVMYHSYVKKDLTEVKAKRAKIDQAAVLKKKRREEQEGNVRRKKEIADDKRDKKKQRRQERETAAMEELRGAAAAAEDSDSSNNSAMKELRGAAAMDSDCESE